MIFLRIVVDKVHGEGYYVGIKGHALVVHMKNKNIK